MIAPCTTWRKHFPGASHGRRYTYGVLRVTPGVVHWRRSDGLRGETSVVEWEALYQLAHLPAQEPGPGQPRAPWSALRREREPTGPRRRRAA